jgi:hypothetical protein
MRWLILTVSLATALTAQQVATGTLTGTITDPDGRAVARIGVTVTNVATKTVYQAGASAAGEYVIPKLPAGVYQLTTQGSLIAFNHFVRDNVQIVAGQTAKVDIHLEEGVALNTLGDGRDFGAARAAAPRRAPPSGPTPRTPTGKPDFSGFWAVTGAPSDLGIPEFTDSAMALAKARQADDIRDAPSAMCLPNGIVWAVTSGNAQRVIQSADLLVMFAEGQLPRQIFLDGRKHPADPNPTWLGHSIGRWDGDTLIVDSVGFNDKAWLDLDGHPQTETMHLVERYRRPDLGHLELELIVEEPGSLKKPWTLKRTYNFDANDDILEYVCTEYERDLAHTAGK